MKKLSIAFLITVLMSAGIASASTIYVDASAAPGGNGSAGSPYLAIQTGINAAVAGDEVVVAPGLYVERIDLLGKNIRLRSSNPADATVISSTIIDGSAAGTVVTIANGETAAAIVEGFTIRNGSGSDAGSIAGGIFIFNASPTVRNNIISGNLTTADGGGLAVMGNSTALIQNNTITNNSAEGWGGGVFVMGEIGDFGEIISTAAPVLKANHIEGNTAFWDGGGVCFFEACTGTMENSVVVENTAGQVGGGVFVGFDVQATLLSNTIAYNEAQGSSIVETSGTVDRVGFGGGLATWFSGASVVNSTIFWGNVAKNAEGNQISLEGDAQLTVSYSNLPGGQAAIYVESLATLSYADGNVDVDPLFASAFDFHLQSRAGRYDPSTGSFVNDTLTSELIDAGDPALAFSNETQPNGDRRNMGAFGNTLQASRTALAPPVIKLGQAQFDYVAGLVFFDVVMVDNGGLTDQVMSFGAGAMISGAGAASLMAAPDEVRYKTGADMATMIPGYAWSSFNEGVNANSQQDGKFMGFGHTTSPSTAVALADIVAGSVLARFYFAWDGNMMDELVASLTGYEPGAPIEFFNTDLSVRQPTVIENNQDIVRELTISIAHDNWVYQNTSGTEDRHRLPVTVTVLDDNGNANTSYIVTIIQTGGLGAVNFGDNISGDPLIRDIVGARRTDGTEGVGDASLKIVVTGNNGGVAMTTATVAVRKLGDINADGFVTPTDKGALNSVLNGLPPSYQTRAYDINGDGSVAPTDKGMLNAILNGVIVN